MNAIKLLLNDHKKMKKLLKQLEQTSERALQKRKDLFKLIKHEAKIHEKMEELYLYKLLKEHKESRPNVFEHHEEVALLEYMIPQLSRLKVNTEEWTAKYKVFKEINDHHIEEEEDEKFPQAIKLLSKEELMEAGAKMALFKKKYEKK